MLRRRILDTTPPIEARTQSQPFFYTRNLCCLLTDLLALFVGSESTTLLLDRPNVCRRCTHNFRPAEKYETLASRSRGISVSLRTLQISTMSRPCRLYRLMIYTVNGKNGPPKHVKITLWIENVSDYFSLYHEMPSICNVHVKFHDNYSLSIAEILLFIKR